MSNIQAEAVTFDLWQTLIQDNRDLRRTRTMRRLEGTQVILNEAGYSYSLDFYKKRTDVVLENAMKYML